MLKNYLTLTLRMLRKHPGYTAINVFGLAVGLACCLLIVLFVRDERSYDRFHEKADRIVRVTQHLSNTRQGEVRWALAPDPMAEALATDFPEIEQTARIGVNRNKLVQYGDTRLYEDGFAFADPALFDLFDFPVLQGDPATSLTRPFTVFLSESTARRYFGADDPLGKLLTLDNQYTFEVTGVFADLPENTHLAFDFVASRESIYAMGQERGDWYYNALTYLLLPDAAAGALEAKLPVFARKHLGEETSRGFSLLPLTAIHLYAADVTGDVKPQGDIRYVYLFAAIALLILAIACINYMNLATARAAMRAREVGVRKVVGAGRGQLIRQFLSESVVLSLIALAGALALVEALLPLFNTLMARSLDFDLTENLQLLVLLAAAVLFVGIAAGSYPALFLSAFRPARVLKGDLRTGTSGALRKGLVVFQFGVSVALIACTVIIQQQMHFVQQQRPGFDEAQIVSISTRGGMVGRSGLLNGLKEQYDAFKTALLQLPGVEHVATTASLMGAAEISFLKGENFEGGIPDDNEEGGLVMDGFRVDYDFFETMGLDFVAGRPFSEAFPSDAETSIIINETAARKLGWDDAVGKWMQPDEQRVTVIGVVKDFHYKTHKAAIEPMYLRLTTEAANFVIAKLRPDDLPGTLASIEAVWDRMVPALPFRYSFLDDEFDALYRAEQRLGQLFGTFACLAIVVACLGLFGLAAFTAEQRTKEIGVRKILGASVPGLVVLLSKDFIRLLGIAFLLACPVAYFGMQRWLEDFVYRIELSAQIFLVAGLLALLVAVLTVSYQAVKAALTNPMKSLRYE